MGLFVKGKSGNPGGRKKLPPDVRELAKAHTAEAIHVLAACMKNKDARVQVAAATALLDRGWGRPAQAVTGEYGGPVQVEHAIVDPKVLHERLAALVGKASGGTDT